MPKILVDKNELKSLRDSIDKLLKLDEYNTKVNKQEGIYKQDDFDEKEKLIIKYVKNNPGTTKQGVVNNIKTISRNPIFKKINKLVQEGVIVIKADQFNSQIHHLYINNENVLVILNQDLDSLKKTYLSLIDETKDILESLEDSIDLSNDTIDDIGISKKIQQRHLVNALLIPYKSLLITTIVPDFLWNEEPIDKETFYKKFAIINSQLPEIQIKLYDSISVCNTYINTRDIMDEIFNNLKGLSLDNIYEMLVTFEEHGLSENAEAVLDCIWKICFPILPIMDTTYYHEDQPEILKDWRKILVRFTSSLYAYIPKTTQNPSII